MSKLNIKITAVYLIEKLNVLFLPKGKDYVK